LFACLQFYNVKSGNTFYPGSTFFASDKDYFLHAVEKGQTVYSIASMYGIPTGDIYKLNPQSKDFIKAGEKLKIPRESGSYVYHVIQPKETLYALSRQYRIEGKDILDVNPGLSVRTFQIGRVVRIPINRVVAPLKERDGDKDKSKINSLLNRASAVQSVDPVQAVLLLPFGLKNNEGGENTGGRMVEYLEGFLLALKTLKSKGISVNLHVYNIGSDAKDISGILKKDNVRNAHLIIGGVSDEHIKIISRFSNVNRIPYVIPFTSMSDEPFYNPSAYQVNMPQSILHAKVSSLFINKYEKYHVLLVMGEKGASNQSEFTGLLRSDMQEKKIAFKTVPLKRLSDYSFISELNRHKNNVLIPDDDSPETLEKMITSLLTVRKKHPEYQIALFGYPRWQTFGSTFAAGFFQLRASFFSVFYANMIAGDIKDFYTIFHQWYGHSISYNFPKFGILGYDTGMYFIQAVHTYGTNFAAKINELKYNGLQTDFYFERANNWSGFINGNVFLVNYNPDNSITRTNVK
jgi:LysM repeat protein